MRFKQLLTKTLLVAAGLCVGASAWADTETVTVLSEDYESYAVGDITSTMESNGWTFQSKNKKNQIKIVQGSGDNTTKYFDFYYPDGGASRNQSWTFGTSSSLNADNWKLTFSAALNPGTDNSANRFDVFGTKSGKVNTANDAVTNPLFRLAATAAGGEDYTPSIGGTSYSNVTLASGTWYKFIIDATAANETTATIHIKITSYDGATTKFEQTIENMAISAIGIVNGFCWNSPRTNSRLSLDDVLLTKEVDASVCADPTYIITGADGASRKFTLACETAESTIYYATSNLEKGADGWTTYTGEVTTAATTIYAYAEKGTKSSNIINFTTGAGTAITLNAPTIYVNNMIANGTGYNAQFGAWYNTAGVEFTPNAELSATFTPDGGAASAVTLPYTATQKGTLTITSTADGFTSAQTEISVPAVYTQSWQSVDFSSLSGAEAIGTAVGGTWTLQAGHGRWSSWADKIYNFYQHGEGGAATVTVNDKIRMREVVLLAEGMGLGRNVTSGENISVITTTGQIVGFEMYNGYGAAINKGVNTFKTYVKNTSGNPSVSVTNGALLVQATIYAPAVSATIGSTGWTTFASQYPLDLSGMTASTGEVTAYYASAVGGSSVTMTSTESDAVAAGEGLMLKGTAGATITIPVVASGSAISGNKLVGCPTATELTTPNANYYVLVSNEGTAEFQNLSGSYTDNKVTIPAGKAYLDASESSAKSLTIVFDNETLGISDAKLLNGNTEGIGEKAIYNLSGQRIAAPQKGINIIGGRKVVVK